MPSASEYGISQASNPVDLSGIDPSQIYKQGLEFRNNTRQYQASQAFMRLQKAGNDPNTPEGLDAIGKGLANAGLLAEGNQYLAPYQELQQKKANTQQTQIGNIGQQQEQAKKIAEDHAQAMNDAIQKGKNDPTFDKVKYYQDRANALTVGYPDVQKPISYALAHANSLILQGQAPPLQNQDQSKAGDLARQQYLANFYSGSDGTGGLADAQKKINDFVTNPANKGIMAQDQGALNARHTKLVNLLGGQAKVDAIPELTKLVAGAETQLTPQTQEQKNTQGLVSPEVKNNVSQSVLLGGDLKDPTTQAVIQNDPKFWSERQKDWKNKYGVTPTNLQGKLATGNEQYDSHINEYNAVNRATEFAPIVVKAYQQLALQGRIPSWNAFVSNNLAKFGDPDVQNFKDNLEKYMTDVASSYPGEKGVSFADDMRNKLSVATNLQQVQNIVRNAAKFGFNNLDNVKSVRGSGELDQSWQKAVATPELGLTAKDQPQNSKMRLAGLQDPLGNKLVIKEGTKKLNTQGKPIIYKGGKWVADQ
jgi:hypothetical protein